MEIVSPVDKGNPNPIVSKQSGGGCGEVVSKRSFARTKHETHYYPNSTQGLGSKAELLLAVMAPLSQQAFEYYSQLHF